MYRFAICSQMFQRKRERVGVKEQEQKEQIQQNGECQLGVCDCPFYCAYSYSKNFQLLQNKLLLFLNKTRIIDGVRSQNCVYP